MSINDGGSAFPMASGPEPRVNESTHFNEGMSLRDYFAAAAMQGLAGSGLDFGSVQNPCSPWLWVAQQCYLAADAMLAEREREAR